MKARALRAAVAASFIVVIAAAPAAAKDRWVHVRVQEGGPGSGTVAINLPFSLLESVAPLLEESKIGAEKIRLGEKELGRGDLKVLWEALRKAEEGEYVTIASEGEKVRVAKMGEFLTISARDGSKGAQKVDVKMPLSVLDALLSGPADTLDFVAALKALEKSGEGDLVTVNDSSSTVRIWIDGKNE